MRKTMLRELELAIKKGEVPVAAIIIRNNQIVASAHNNVETNNDPLGHAEIIVIKKAAKKLKTWKLEDCELYVSLEPCEMCESIIKRARISKIFFFVDKKYKKSNSVLKQKIKLDDINEIIEKNIVQFFVKLRKNK